jgi:hypothetical protein
MLQRMGLSMFTGVTAAEIVRRSDGAESCMFHNSESFLE